MEVFELAAPNWVRIVEEHRINQPQSIMQVQEILDVMKEFNPDKIVLACTHYPYLTGILKNSCRKINLLILHYICTKYKTGLRKK